MSRIWIWLSRLRYQEKVSTMLLRDHQFIVIWVELLWLSATMLHNLQLFHWTRLETTQSCSLNEADVFSEHTWMKQMCSLNTHGLFYTYSLNTHGDNDISNRVQRMRLEIFKHVRECAYSSPSVFREHVNNRPSVFREHAWMVSKHVQWNIR